MEIVHYANQFISESVCEICSTPHRRANARLIAAAPDLLQACETALAVITELTDNWPMPVKALLPVKSLLQETIAKAQGAPTK